MNMSLRACTLVVVAAWVLACGGCAHARGVNTGIATARVEPTYPPGPRRSGPTNLASLLKDAAERPWVSVILRLHVGGAGAGVAQQAPKSIGAAQEELLRGLRGTGFTVKHLYKHIPYANLDVDRAALARLTELGWWRGFPKKS